MSRSPIRLVAVALLSWAVLAHAERVENGNDLALRFVTAAPNRQGQVGEDAVGKTFFFRYLRIASIERGVTNGAPWLRLATVEPSSDLRIEFVARKPESVARAESLRTNDAVAVTGRVQSMDAARRLIALEPAIVRYKDRAAPVAGKEFLHEVDPRARAGTDTSTGAEVVQPGTAAKARAAEPPNTPRPKETAP
jgi:hypothetical protein